MAARGWPVILSPDPTQTCPAVQANNCNSLLNVSGRHLEYREKRINCWELKHDNKRERDQTDCDHVINQQTTRHQAPGNLSELITISSLAQGGARLQAPGAPRFNNSRFISPQS